MCTETKINPKVKIRCVLCFMDVLVHKSTVVVSYSVPETKFHGCIYPLGFLLLKTAKDHTD